MIAVTTKQPTHGSCFMVMIYRKPFTRIACTLANGTNPALHFKYLHVFFRGKTIGLKIRTPNMSDVLFSILAFILRRTPSITLLTTISRGIISVLTDTKFP
jgi:hypothetical protein